ncbi:MAG: hypothetical protein QM725_04755 [Lacibacter sp.]
MKKNIPAPKANGVTASFVQSDFNSIILKSLLIIGLAFLFLIPSAVKAQSDYSRLFLTNYNNDRIEKINVDGTGQTTVVSNASGVPTWGPVAVAVDVPHGKIYWFEDYNKEIKRANIDGSGVEVFVTASGWAYTLFVDTKNNHLYWPNYEGDKIERINLDGTGRTTVVSNASGVPTWGPVGITVGTKNGKIYWFEDYNKRIKRANLDGSSVEVFVTGSGWAYTLYIDKQNSKLYWPNYEADKIERINLDGTGRADVVTSASGVTNYGPIGITLDVANNKIYWFEDAGYSVKRANLDGSSVSTFIASTGWAYNLVIPVDETITTLPVTFVAFSAHCKNDKVLLNWQTATEEGTKNFAVQHSIDGKEWKQIALVNAAGNNVGLLNYGYEHKKPSIGINYYRLLQTDIQGETSYSKVRTVDYYPANKVFLVLGNPVAGNAIKVQMLKQAEISVYDSQGHLFYRKLLNEGVHEIPCSLFNKAVYYVKGGTVTEQVVLQ